jgi:GT2 family glycosyltransferase
MSSLKVAVVILNFNGRKHLETFLPSIVANSNPHTVIIAENASTDDSVDFLKTNFPQIRLVHNAENHGFARGYNDALEQVKGEFDAYLLLNSDVEVTPNWLAPLIQSLENEKIVAVQPKILSYLQKDSFEHAGACGGHIDSNYFPFCRGRIFDQLEKDLNQYDNLQQVAWTSGAAMLIRSEAFHQAEGFDADFFAHMEEIDLCLRLQRKGYQLVCNPKSVVYHLGGGTLPYNSPNKIYLNFRNNLFMLVKNHQGLLFPKLFFRMLLDGIAAFKFFSEGKLNFTWKVFLAHMALYSNFGKMYRKRLALKADKQAFFKYDGSILWAYFIQKNKTYSSLNQRKFK